MVNDTVDIAAHILDFNLDSSTSLPQPQNHSLQHSSSNSTLRAAKKQTKVHDHLAKQEQQGQQITSNLNILPNSAENLSWTFFEHVSTLDNQLRGDEELSSTTTNGCHLMSTSPTQTYAIHEDVDARLLISHSGPTQETISRKRQI